MGTSRRFLSRYPLRNSHMPTYLVLRSLSGAVGQGISSVQTPLHAAALISANPTSSGADPWSAQLPQVPPLVVLPRQGPWRPFYSAA
jgi:hypothetical protein